MQNVQATASHLMSQQSKQIALSVHNGDSPDRGDELLLADLHGELLLRLVLLVRLQHLQHQSHDQHQSPAPPVQCLLTTFKSLLFLSNYPVQCPIYYA